MTVFAALLAFLFAVGITSGPLGYPLAVIAVLAVATRAAYRADRPAGYRGPLAGAW